MHGRIGKLRLDQGFGFITADNEVFDRFFHRGDVSLQSELPFSDLQEGDRVEFDGYELDGKKRARDVKIIRGL